MPNVLIMIFLYNTVSPCQKCVDQIQTVVNKVTPPPSLSTHIKMFLSETVARLPFCAVLGVVACDYRTLKASHLETAVSNFSLRPAGRYSIIKIDSATLSVDFIKDKKQTNILIPQKFEFPVNTWIQWALLGYITARHKKTTQHKFRVNNEINANI